MWIQPKKDKDIYKLPRQEDLEMSKCSRKMLDIQEKKHVCVCGVSGEALHGGFEFYMQTSKKKTDELFWRSSKRKPTMNRWEDQEPAETVRDGQSNRDLQSFGEHVERRKSFLLKEEETITGKEFWWSSDGETSPCSKSGPTISNLCGLYCYTFVCYW